MINYKKKRENGGVSLVETVIYVGILVLLMAITVSSLIFLSRSYKTFTATRSLNQSGGDAIEAITKLVRNEHLVDPILSTFQVATSTVAFNGGNKIFVEDGSLKIREDGTTRTLTRTNVTVEEFYANHIETTNSKAIKVRLELTSPNTGSTGATSTSGTYYTTVVMRSSY